MWTKVIVIFEKTKANIPWSYSVTNFSCGGSAIPKLTQKRAWNALTKSNPRKATPPRYMVSLLTPWPHGMCPNGPTAATAVDNGGIGSGSVYFVRYISVLVSQHMILIWQWLYICASSICFPGYLHGRKFEIKTNSNDYFNVKTASCWRDTGLCIPAWKKTTTEPHIAVFGLTSE